MVRRTQFAAVMLLAGLAASVSAPSQKQEIVVTITTEDDRPSQDRTPFEGSRPAVDVALLLDTSNSMDGLISQAKHQLWTIVQQFAKAQQRGQTPRLRVALFEYGNTNLPASEGYLRQVVPLTDDLDCLSEGLFGLTTQGGDEYCGQVIDEALTRLDWSGEPNAYQAVFIAGNEPFTQGSVDYRDACQRAIERGVVVNTIHCGAWQAGVDGSWQDGARRAEGKYFNIDQDRRHVHIHCPQDEIILRLNAELNTTYLWFGKREARETYRSRQLAQDANAAGESAPTAVTRAAVKAGRAYTMSGRDLVDSYVAGGRLLSTLDREDLPEAMQQMTPDEQEAYVRKMADRRAELQAEIAKWSAAREEYLRQQEEQRAEDPEQATLGDAILEAVRSQLTDAGFELKQD